MCIVKYLLPTLCIAYCHHRHPLISGIDDTRQLCRPKSKCPHSTWPNEGIDLFHQFVHLQGYGTPRQLGRGPTVIRIHHIVCRVFKRPPALRFARRPRSPNDAAYLKRQLIGLQIPAGQSNQNGIARECPHLRYVHRRTDKEHRHSKGNCGNNCRDEKRTLHDASFLGMLLPTVCAFYQPAHAGPPNTHRPDHKSEPPLKRVVCS